MYLFQTLQGIVPDDERQVERMRIEDELFIFESENEKPTPLKGGLSGVLSTAALYDSEWKSQ